MHPSIMQSLAFTTHHACCDLSDNYYFLYKVSDTQLSLTKYNDNNQVLWNINVTGDFLNDDIALYSRLMVINNNVILSVNSSHLSITNQETNLYSSTSRACHILNINANGTDILWRVTLTNFNTLVLKDMMSSSGFTFVGFMTNGNIDISHQTNLNVKLDNMYSYMGCLCAIDNLTGVISHFRKLQCVSIFHMCFKLSKGFLYLGCGPYTVLLDNSQSFDNYNVIKFNDQLQQVSVFTSNEMGHLTTDDNNIVLYISEGLTLYLM